MTEGESVLGRWSRLKRIQKEQDPEQAAINAEARELPEGKDGSPSAPPPDLPDIEDLNENSDFSVFLQEGVPDDLRKLALRKLWKSDPVLANLDGLNDYDEDFSIVQPLAAGVAEELKKALWGDKAEEPVKENDTDDPVAPELHDTEPPTEQKDNEDDLDDSDLDDGQ